MMGDGVVQTLLRAGKSKWPEIDVDPSLLAERVSQLGENIEPELTEERAADLFLSSAAAVGNNSAVGVFVGEYRPLLRSMAKTPRVRLALVSTTP